MTSTDAKTIFWRSLKAREGAPEVADYARYEFTEEAESPLQVPETRNPIGRRRFLALTGASAAFAAMGCTKPHDRGDIIPYTDKPPEVTIGNPVYYASTMQEGLHAHSVVVKAREGRPIHIEGNDKAPFSQGKTSLRALADVLTLYDPERVPQPLKDGAPATWERSISDLSEALAKAGNEGKHVLLITPAVLSPSRAKLLSALQEAYPQLDHIAWEPLNFSSVRSAAKALLGQEMLPSAHLAGANVILSLGSDFLSTDPLYNGAEESFSASRTVRSSKDSMSRLYTVEGRYTLTGLNSDYRIALKPSAIASFAFALIRELSIDKKIPLPAGIDATSFEHLRSVIDREGIPEAAAAQLVTDLASNRGYAAILAGSELPAEAHAAAIILNKMLGSKAGLADKKALVRYTPLPEFHGLVSAKKMRAVIDAMANGRYAAAIMSEVNPCYDAEGAAQAFEKALAYVPFRVHHTLTKNETSTHCHYLLPASHWLESWGDYLVQTQYLSVQQPLIDPLFDSKQAEDIFLALIAGSGARVPSDPLSYIKARWAEEVADSLQKERFEYFWRSAVHDGCYALPGSIFSGGISSGGIPNGNAPERTQLIESVSPTAVQRAAKRARDSKASEWELVIHPDARLFDGRYAHNGWLQELPEPVTKVVWDNPLLVAPADAKRYSLSDNDVVRITADNTRIEAPIVIQPGQAAGVLAIARGFGHTVNAVAAAVGSNPEPLLAHAVGGVIPSVALKKTGKQKSVARTQDHHTIGEHRDADMELVKVFSLAAYKHGRHMKGKNGHHKDDHAAKSESNNTQAQGHSGEDHSGEGGGGKNGAHHSGSLSLYPGHDYSPHKWEMTIDLNACTGCSACVIACQSENNIPVVGPDEVANGREMHWIRLDRYYVGEPEDPEARVQPMLCQHCDNAPCENVCPVLATTHSPDGLNQMTYNRCVGTRYCANNCPYKVRRFNFFEFTNQLPELRAMVFNPEVTVRPRGVMEKCTFCIQRIQDVKQRAKSEGREIRDGEMQTACQIACPANAISFGNVKDKESEVAKLVHNDRSYRVLDKLGVEPSVTYLAKLRNRDEEAV